VLAVQRRDLQAGRETAGSIGLATLHDHRTYRTVWMIGLDRDAQELACDTLSTANSL
jgi:hypothetical protein